MGEQFLEQLAGYKGSGGGVKNGGGEKMVTNYIIGSTFDLIGKCIPKHELKYIEYKSWCITRHELIY